MKKAIYICFLLIAIVGCKKNSYSDLLKAEGKLIDNYISRNNITVLTAEPSNWKENVYWQIPDAGVDNFYFHLVDAGDTSSAPIDSHNTVFIRFKRYGLEEHSDTLYNWTILDSPEPINTTEYTCTGWQIALKHMKYNGAQCKIICPSKLGFSDEKNSVTPYGYHLKITNIK